MKIKCHKTEYAKEKCFWYINKKCLCYLKYNPYFGLAD